MRDVIYVKLDIVYSINQQVNDTILRNSDFWNSEIESDNFTVWNSELSFSISPRNLYNSLKSIKET